MTGVTILIKVVTYFTICYQLEARHRFSPHSMRGIVQGCDLLAVTFDCINRTAVGSTPDPEFYRHFTHYQRGAQFLLSIDSAPSVPYCQSSLLASLPLRISWTEVRDMFFLCSTAGTMCESLWWSLWNPLSLDFKQRKLKLTLHSYPLGGKNKNKKCWSSINVSKAFSSNLLFSSYSNSFV